MTNEKRFLMAGAAIIAVSGVGSAAMAQTAAKGFMATSTGSTASNFERDRNVAVLSRPHEGYDAKGLPLGGFRLFPKVAVTAEHNDNIYALPTNEVSDTVWRVQPELNLVSNWSRHSLNLFARGTLSRYSDFGTEDSDDYSFGGSGKLDITRKSNITASADYNRLTEPRTSPSAPANAAEPTRYDLTNATIAGEQEFNRLKLSGSYGHQKYDYEDVPRIGLATTIDQDYRDKTVQTLMGRADYAVSPDTALFLEVTGNRRNFRQEAPTVALDRDSDGVQALVGANFELGSVTRGEIGVGYISQKYDSAAVSDISGVGARAQVEWFPTQITTVTVTGSRSVGDSVAAGSAGYMTTAVGATIDHELMRNVIISANATYGKDDYENIDRKDKRVNAGVSATYLLNHNVGVTVAYSYADTSSSGAQIGAEFTVNKVGATLTLQF